MDLEIGRSLKRPTRRNRREKIRYTASTEDWILVSALSDSLSRIPTYPADHILPRRMFRKDSAFNNTRIRWIQFIARTEILYFSSVEVELRACIKSSGPNGRSDNLTYADVWLDRSLSWIINAPNDGFSGLEVSETMKSSKAGGN